MTDLQKPIPLQAEPDWIACAGVPIVESGQPLVALGLSQRLVVYPAYHRLGVPEALPDCHVRHEVFERLLFAAAALPQGVCLAVLDGWRPLAVQQHLYRSLTQAIAGANPELPAEQLLALTRQFVSIPSVCPQTPSPHLPGGAVDVMLTDEAGRWLDMGSEFDAACARSFTHFYEQIAEPSADQIAVRSRRRMLYNAMQAAGFSNLASEWWHYDFGNQLWAWSTGADRAHFGLASLESVEQRWKRQLQHDGVAGQVS